MVNYNKKLPTRSVSWKKMSFSSFQNGMNTKYDEHLVPINYSKRTYNFSFKDGALKTGAGIEEINFPYNDVYLDRTKTLVEPTGITVQGTWLYTYYDSALKKYQSILLLYGSDKKIYWNILNTSTTTFEVIANFELQEVPNIINYKLNGIDVVIFTSDADGMYYWYYGLTEPIFVEDAPSIMSMCVHQERLFATVSGERSEVWFSDDLDPTNWSVSLNEAGFIQMADERGPLNKVISLNDYVYVFREYGVSRVVAYGNQENFSVNHLYFSNSKIYENTVCACGDTILFLTNDGLYAFDGVNASKLSLNFEGLLNPNSSSRAAYHNGKYYLATRMDFADDTVVGSEVADSAFQGNNNVLIELDVQTGDIDVMRGVDIVSLNSVNHKLFSRLFIVTRVLGVLRLGQLDTTGAVFGQPTHKYWMSPETDLGYATSEKLLKEIYVKNNKQFLLEVETERETKQFEIAATESISRVRLNMRGTVFTFRFLSYDSEAYISNPQIIFGVL